VDFLEAILRLAGWILGWLFGWPLHLFRRWLDRDPSQISSVERLGRLMLGFTLTLCVLIPLGWLIFR
jgi:hypothetical protein